MCLSGDSGDTDEDRHCCPLVCLKNVSTASWLTGNVSAQRLGTGSSADSAGHSWCWGCFMLGHGWGYMIHTLPFPKTQESGQEQRMQERWCRRTPGTEATATEGAGKKGKGQGRELAPPHHPRLWASLTPGPNFLSFCQYLTPWWKKMSLWWFKEVKVMLMENSLSSSCNGSLSSGHFLEHSTRGGGVAWILSVLHLELFPCCSYWQ